MSYNSILDSEIAPGQPVTTSLIGRLRDNPFSALNQEPGSPLGNFVPRTYSKITAGTYTFVVPSNCHAISGWLVGGGQAGAVNGGGFGGDSTLSINGVLKVTAGGGKPTATYSISAPVNGYGLAKCVPYFLGYYVSGDSVGPDHSYLQSAGGGSPVFGGGVGICNGSGGGPGAGGGGDGIGGLGGYSGYGVRFWVAVTPGDTLTIVVGAGGANAPQNGAPGGVEIWY